MLALIGLAVGWFTLMGSYVLAMHVKKLRDEGTDIPLFWLVNVLPWVMLGLALDVAFNLVAGTLMFVELPRELLFTARCKRHFRAGEGWRLELAQWWARALNTWDPTHITPPKG